MAGVVRLPHPLHCSSLLDATPLKCSPAHVKMFAASFFGCFLKILYERSLIKSERGENGAKEV